MTKISSGKSGEPPAETLYTYDESGRVSEVQAAANEEIFKQGGAVKAMDLSWDEPKEEIPPPTSGKVRVLYDDRGHPTELQLFDTQGHLVCRLVRTYDANGRIIEEGQILENPGQLFAKAMPTEQAAKFNDKQLHALNEALKGLLRGRKGTGVFYSYDAQGHLAAVCQRNFAFETTTAISYNEHGDKSEARVGLGPNNVIPPGRCSIDENGTIIPSEQVPRLDFPTIAVRGQRRCISLYVWLRGIRQLRKLDPAEEGHAHGPRDNYHRASPHTHLFLRYMQFGANRDLGFASPSSAV